MTEDKQKKKFAVANMLPILAICILAVVVAYPNIRKWQEKNNREEVEFTTAELQLKSGKRDEFRELVKHWIAEMNGKDADVIARKLEQTAAFEIRMAQIVGATKGGAIEGNRFSKLPKDTFFRVFELYRAAYKIRMQIKTENDLALLIDLNQLALVCALNGMEDFASKLNEEFEKLSQEHSTLLTERKDISTDFLLVKALCSTSKKDLNSAEKSLLEASQYCIGTDISNDEIRKAIETKTKPKFARYPSIETQIFCLSKLVEVCEKQNDERKIIESQGKLIEMQSKAIRDLQESEAASEYQNQQDEE